MDGGNDPWNLYKIESVESRSTSKHSACTVFWLEVRVGAYNSGMMRRRTEISERTKALDTKTLKISEAVATQSWPYKGGERRVARDQTEGERVPQADHKQLRHTNCIVISVQGMNIGRVCEC